MIETARPYALTGILMYEAVHALIGVGQWASFAFAEYDVYEVDVFDGSGYQGSLDRRRISNLTTT